MSVRWRWSLVVVLAAMVLGGFIPQAFLVGRLAPASMAVASRTGPPTFPSGCSGASCSKSSPGAPTPSLTIAALAATVGIAAAAALNRFSRRNRPGAHALPRGSTLTLLRPPQFS
jgi:ABC-type Fe3+ transport system permease subunit